MDLSGLAALAGALRLRLGNKWRTIHWFIYLAFVFAAVHGALIGSSFRFLPIRIVVGSMAAAVVAVCVRKRLAKTARPALFQATGGKS